MKKTIFNRRNLAFILTIIVLLVALAACASEPKSTEKAVKQDYDLVIEEPMAAPEEAYDEMGIAGGDFSVSDRGEMPVEDDLKSPLANRKIIKSYSYSIETKEFDETLNNIMSSVDSTHGYISFSNVYASGYSDRGPKRADLEIRIPAQYVPQFREQLKGAGKIINQGEESEDITHHYFDTEQRIQSLEGQLSRLNALYEKAEMMMDIIEIQSKIEDVTRELEYLKGQKSRMDHYIEYSTITIHLAEVQDYTHTEAVSKSLSERIGDAFSQMLINVKRGGENFVVEFVYFLPSLLLLIILVVIVVLIVRRVKKRRKKDPSKTDTGKKKKRFFSKEKAGEEDKEDINPEDPY